MGEVATILVSPFFRGGAIVAAVIWLLFVGEPQRARRHPAWGIIGWSIAGIIFAAIIGTAGYGAFEIELRRLANDRAIEIIKGNQSPGVNQGPDIQLSGPRAFTGKQTVILIQELSKLKQDIPMLYLTTPPGDNEAMNYRYFFTQFLSRTGIQWNDQDEIPESTDATGLMVAVRDPANVPPIAQKVREAFEVADIHVGATRMPANWASAKDIQFLLFFGPRPLVP